MSCNSLGSCEVPYESSVVGKVLSSGAPTGYASAHLSPLCQTSVLGSKVGDGM